MPKPPQTHWSAQLRLAERLAEAYLSGDWDAAAIAGSGLPAVQGRSGRAVRRLISEIRARTVTPYTPAPRKLEQYIGESEDYEHLHDDVRAAVCMVPQVLAPARMTPIPAFENITLPRLVLPGELAAWLNIPRTRLDWFADIAGRLTRHPEGALQHYRFRWVPKRSGLRLIEAPKYELKRVQQRILREILDPSETSRHLMG